MRLLLALSMLLIPTITQAAPSNLQLYMMQQNQMLEQTADNVERDAKINSMKNDMEELQSKQRSQSVDINSDMLLLLLLKNHPELLKELQK
jgi:hypothetical protein